MIGGFGDRNFMKNKWKKIAVDLAVSLSKTSIRCEYVSHGRGEYHSHSEECPVCIKIDAALERFDQMLALDKASRSK